MRRGVSLIFAVAICLFLTSCNKDTGKAYEIAQDVYFSLEIAYNLTDLWASDYYQAWSMGVHIPEEIVESGVSYLAKDMNLSEKDLATGIAYTAVLTEPAFTWDMLTNEQQQMFVQDADSLLAIFETNKVFNICINSVINAYILNNTRDKIISELDQAKVLIKLIGDEFPEYEYYPSLKSYYSTVLAFLNFCEVPTGTYERLSPTINDYRNSVRNYKSELSFIFEDS